MLLNYLLDENFCKHEEELLEAHFWNYEYDYQVDVSSKDIIEFFITQNANLDKETIKYLEDNNYFIDLEEDDDRFYVFMLKKYKEQAYKNYRQEFEEYLK